VDALVTLAGDVKAMLPAAQISYAADWSEYHSHRVGGEVHFHLDPLWACEDVDFIGIDNYLPLSDWRPGTAHADYDAANGVTSVYSLDYLKSQIEGGEYWDYYYASQADRDSQDRTEIQDLTPVFSVRTPAGLVSDGASLATGVNGLLYLGEGAAFFA
jgi:hypothetical protein